MLGESERCRALFELAVQQPLLEKPEALWRACIDFEIAQGDRGRTRALYERLLDRTKHVKVRYYCIGVRQYCSGNVHSSVPWLSEYNVNAPSRCEIPASLPNVRFI